MLAFRTKRHDNLDLEVLRDIADDVVESDFVPYACLLDENTILTKNGEVMQIIKVTGFSFESVEAESVDLRTTIRQAIEKQLRTNDFAFWFHTMRRKRDLSPEGTFPDRFSHELNEAWNKRNNWSERYINELYISVVREGQDASLRTPGNAALAFVPQRDKAVRQAYIDDSLAKLNDFTLRLLDTLKEYGAKRLGLVEREGIYYAEHLGFLEKLINLEARELQVTRQDLSHYLTSSEISFGFNAMEVRTAEGKRRFGAILTIKEYKESSLRLIDQFMNVPCEFIASQCVDFINAHRALESYEVFKDFARLSGDRDLSDAAELTRILQGNRKRQIDFSEQQTTIFVIGESVRKLEQQLQTIRESLNDIGIVCVREDLKFEECYWAQLPANFEFISRLTMTDTPHIGGFVNLNNFPAGNARGSEWGKPVSLFSTAAGTPYFFNFHSLGSGAGGHTIVIGPRGTGKSVSVNFLLAQARRLNPRIVMVDCLRSNAKFVSAMGGKYHGVAAPFAPATFAPLQLPDSNANREFLALWLSTLIDPQGSSLSTPLLDFFRQLVGHLYTLPAQQRTLSQAVALIATQDEQLAERFLPWLQGDAGVIFGGAEENVDFSAPLFGLGLQALMQHEAMLVPVASYVLHRLTQQFNGEPLLLVLDEAFTLLNNPLFAPRAAAWLQHATTKNVAAIMMSENVAEAASHGFTASIVPLATSIIVMPDYDPDESYLTVFGLSPEEFAYLDSMDIAYRHFLLKRKSGTIIAELNLDELEDFVTVLSSSPSEEPEPEPEPEGRASLALPEEAAFDLAERFSTRSGGG